MIVIGPDNFRSRLIGQARLFTSRYTCGPITLARSAALLAPDRGHIYRVLHGFFLSRFAIENSPFGLVLARYFSQAELFIFDVEHSEWCFIFFLKFCFCHECKDATPNFSF